MRDVQSLPDERNIPINKVGVRNLQYPITVLDKEHRTQETVATISLYADLPHSFKGTHMSRFIEVFHQYSGDVQMPNFLDMLDEIRKRLDARDAYGELDFPFFLEKHAPVSGQPAVMSYNCAFKGTVFEAHRDFFVAVTVPVTTLCPCSKDISARGAHNQRSLVTVTVQLGPFFWIEDLIELVESCASAPLYTLLKREDEKYVTEHAYDNPVFAEDLVREICVAVEKRYEFPWYSVEAVNQESIHYHDAYAYVERGAIEGARG
ncbi:MAG: GTP cyclohydrolase FolE2 [Spirochaetaceae bacterium]